MALKSSQSNPVEARRADTCWRRRCCCWRRSWPSRRATRPWPKPRPERRSPWSTRTRVFVERKKDGRFIARPVFDRKPASLYYGVRHPDSGDWLTAIYRVQRGEKERRDGWEYSWDYPFEDDQPDLDPEQAYLLVMLARDGGSGELHTFHAVTPVHQPGGLWNKILGALDPGRWAKAFARWTIEGVHGTLCGVVEKASGEDAANCRGD